MSELPIINLGDIQPRVNLELAGAPAKKGHDADGFASRNSRSTVRTCHCHISNFSSSHASPFLSSPSRVRQQAPVVVARRRSPVPNVSGHSFVLDGAWWSRVSRSPSTARAYSLLGKADVSLCCDGEFPRSKRFFLMDGDHVHTEGDHGASSCTVSIFSSLTADTLVVQAFHFRNKMCETSSGRFSSSSHHKHDSVASFFTR